MTTQDKLKGRELPEFTCSICGGHFTGHGNNAQPINDGRCCSDCDATVVIPKRMEMHLANRR